MASSLRVGLGTISSVTGEWDTLPYGAAARHLVDEIIEPVQTRDVVIQFLNAWQSRGAIGEHRLANWPTKF